MPCHALALVAGQLWVSLLASRDQRSVRPRSVRDRRPGVPITRAGFSTEMLLMDDMARPCRSAGRDTSACRLVGRSLIPMAQYQALAVDLSIRAASSVPCQAAICRLPTRPWRWFVERVLSSLRGAQRRRFHGEVDSARLWGLTEVADDRPWGGLLETHRSG